MRYTIWLFSLLLSQSAVAQAFKITAETPSDSIYTWLKESKVPAIAVGIIENNTIKTVKVYGECGAGIQATLSAYWNVASLTKPVTAMTVMAFVNAGKWDLDEPVSHYFTDADIKDDPRAAKLTTRILLSHSSGFPNWRYGAQDKKLFFRFEPGARMGYSGEGYEYVRHAMEAKFHKTLQELAIEAVFKRAGMSETQFSWNASLDSNRFAMAHDVQGQKLVQAKRTDINAADWLITTIEDYTRFGIFVNRGAGLSASVFADMHMIHTRFDTLADHKDNGMGLGWQVMEHLTGNEYALAHSGSDNGVKTYIILLPLSGRGIVVFTNGENGDLIKNKVLRTSLPDMKASLGKYTSEFREGLSAH
jgi:CubicO group peptidase (beta-lactamase class C family)